MCARTISSLWLFIQLIVSIRRLHLLFCLFHYHDNLSWLLHSINYARGSVVYLSVRTIYDIFVYLFWQDLAAAVDEEDVAKFTDVVKEFDSMTPLVYFLLPLKS